MLIPQNMAKNQGFHRHWPVPASWHGHAAFWILWPEMLHWGTEELLNTSWHLATNVQTALVRNLHWQGLQHCGPCSLKKQKPSGRNCIILFGWFPCMAWGIRSISNIPNSNKSRVYISIRSLTWKFQFFFFLWVSWHIRQDRIFNAKQTLVPKIRLLAERPERPLRRPSSTALAQRHLRFTEESTTRSLKVGCPASSYQHPPRLWANLDRPAKGWEMTWSCRWS